MMELTSEQLRKRYTVKLTEPVKLLFLDNKNKMTFEEIKNRMTFKERLRALETKHRAEIDVLKTEYLKNAKYKDGDIVMYLASGPQFRFDTVPYYVAVGMISKVDLNSKDEIEYGINQVTLKEGQDVTIPGSCSATVLEENIKGLLGHSGDHLLGDILFRIKNYPTHE